jgi:hypothetical protein
MPVQGSGSDGSVDRGLAPPGLGNGLIVDETAELERYLEKLGSRGETDPHL